MKNTIAFIALIIVLMVAAFSCDRDNYLIDGGVASPYLNMTTYEFLASKPVFDTLVLAINKAGLKEILDGEVTFFAPNNFSFERYIRRMTTLGRTVYNDPLYRYHFDSIPTNLLRDSLKMYIFPGKIFRSDLRKEGDIFTNYAGAELKISLEPERMYTTELTTNPSFVWLISKRGVFWDEYDNIPSSVAERDIRQRIQTSGLISTNGVLHVMQNNHDLFFIQF